MRAFCILFAILVACTLSAMGGCSSAPSLFSRTALLDEPGVFSYDGDTVKTRDLMVERWFAGRTVSPIDIDKCKKDERMFEPILVYVDPAEVEDPSRVGVALSPEEIRQSLTRRTEEAVTSFGRFERVPTRDRAQVIVQSRLVSVNAWADSKITKDKAESVFGTTGVDLSGEVAQNINREAIDTVVTVMFRRPDGSEFCSRRVLGRLVANSGQAIESGSWAYKDVNGSGSTAIEVQNAKLKPEELPKALAVGVQGAIASALPQLERSLWSTAPDARGVHASTVAAK